jgi:hypothetical protein
MVVMAEHGTITLIGRGEHRGSNLMRNKYNIFIYKNTKQSPLMSAYDGSCKAMYVAWNIYIYIYFFFFFLYFNGGVKFLESLFNGPESRSEQLCFMTALRLGMECAKRVFLSKPSEMLWIEGFKRRNGRRNVLYNRDELFVVLNSREIILFVLCRPCRTSWRSALKNMAILVISCWL